VTLTKNFSKYFRIFKHLELNKASDSLYLRFNTHAAGICTLAVKVLLKEAQVENSLNSTEINLFEDTPLLPPLNYISLVGPSRRARYHNL